MISSRRQFTAASFGGVFLLAAACSGTEPALLQHAKSTRALSELRLAFKQAADSSNLAVLADTDEASAAFAAEAEAQKRVVRERVADLKPLFQGSGYADEKAMLEDFDKQLAAYEALDQTVLELAVQNTNLKAQRLAFGAARESANGFKLSLEASAKTVPDKQCEAAGAVSAAVIAIREIQVLELQHIAEPTDPAMDQMEKEMDTLEKLARSSLEKLPSIVGADSKQGFSDASKALDRFQTTHREIVGLSRKNSNVRSSRLSLGEKRTLTSACESSLEALGTALAKRTSSATR